MTGHISAGARRWAEVLQLLAEVVPTGPAGVIVDGMDAHRGVVADRLAATLRAAGRSCVRLSRDAPPADRDGWRADGAVAVADGPHRRARPPADGWTVVVWLRTAPPAAGNGADGGGDRSGGAHVVVDLHDPDWPVIRHVDAALTDRDRWYLAESRAFFAARAATWDARFGHDQAAYAAAVTESGLPIGGTVLDAGCGTGRVLPALRAAVGATGTVVGLDVTPQMLAVARTSPRPRPPVCCSPTPAGSRSPPRPSTRSSPPASSCICPTSMPGCANSPASPAPAAGSCPSTRPAVPPSPPATAAPCAPASHSPKDRCASRPCAPAGGSSATTTRHTGSWPSPGATHRAAAAHLTYSCHRCAGSDSGVGSRVASGV